jgi:hypothetical protein
MPGFSEWLFGSPDKLKKIDTGTKQQQGLHNNILAQAMGMGQQGGGYDLANQYYNNFLGGNQQEAFNQFSAPYLQQFQEQILPRIAERFAGAGALSSSAFGQSLGGAASDFQSQLAQLFSNLQQQAAGQQYNQYNQLAQTGLGYQPFQYIQKEGSGGLFAPLLAGLGLGLGGPLGAGIGSGIGSLFKPKAAANPISGGNAGGGSIGMYPGTNTSGKYGLPTFLGM